MPPPTLYTLLCANSVQPDGGVGDSTRWMITATIRSPSSSWLGLVIVYDVATGIPSAAIEVYERTHAVITGVAVAVGVAVGVCVGEAVGVREGVADGEAVGVLVGVAVGVSVGVSAGV